MAENDTKSCDERAFIWEQVQANVKKSPVTLKLDRETHYAHIFEFILPALWNPKGIYRAIVISIKGGGCFSLTWSKADNSRGSGVSVVADVASYIEHELPEGMFESLTHYGAARSNPEGGTGLWAYPVVMYADDDIETYPPITLREFCIRYNLQYEQIEALIEHSDINIDDLDVNDIF